MRPAQFLRLRALIHALHLELDRLDWTCHDHDMPDEVDIDGELIDHDYHDEVEFCEDAFDDLSPPRWPMCVECGNLSPSCVC